MPQTKEVIRVGQIEIRFLLESIVASHFERHADVARNKTEERKAA